MGAALCVAATGGALCTDAIVAEYADVLTRPKFRFPPGLVQEFLEDLLAASHRVEPTPGIDFCVLDASDNDFVACADAANAHYLVTGNLAHFPAAAWKTTMILNARDLRARLGAADDAGRIPS